MPGPLQEEVTVPMLPPCLCKGGLHQCHNPPTAGHLAVEKTLDQLQREAYWVGIATDVRKVCCTRCQASKLVSPTKAPLTNTPIRTPWQMLAADILEVPVLINLFGAEVKFYAAYCVSTHAHAYCAYSQTACYA